jgi:hypothetical protein
MNGISSNGLASQIRVLYEQLAWLDFELGALTDRIGDLVTEPASGAGSPSPAPRPDGLVPARYA